MIEQQRQLPPRVKITGLWKNTTKSGEQFLGGDLSYSSSIQIWTNKMKKSEKDPDFIMYISQKEPKPKPDAFIADFPSAEPSMPSQSGDLPEIPF